MNWWETFDLYWHEITAWTFVLDLVLVVVVSAWILTIKKQSTSAIAWVLIVLFVPLLGALLFVFFGYQHVHRPVRRIARHRKQFRLTHVPETRDACPGLDVTTEAGNEWLHIGRLAQKVDAFPVTSHNGLMIYYEGHSAFDAKLEAIRAAKHHIHLEYFIFQPDDTGREFIEALTAKAKEGVEVRLVFDAVGSRRLRNSFLRPLEDAGGKVCSFLPLNPLRRRIQLNLRNHRKILVVDGRVAFTGGLNIGDEYLGKVSRFGYWRDTHLRLHGPTVAALQRIFIEDWDYAAEEHLRGPDYFPPPGIDAGVPDDCRQECIAQIIHSGPDQAIKGIREVYFAAILQARRRLWIATPYFLPDAALLDALILAGRRGVDVRLIGQFHPDKWIPYYAGRYYWEEVLNAGVAVYQYTRGMMHSKVLLADGQWASVGTANLDNRSMHLNFEVNCLIYTPDAVAELEAAFQRDLQDSIRLERRVYANRPFPGRLVENGCRLLSPIL